MTGGIAWLYPDAEYWGKYVIMTTPVANYTAADIPTILTKANLLVSVMWHVEESILLIICLQGPLEMYKGVRNLTVRGAPNVTVYCYYGES